jgi:glycosyltransferase involved in cell wall biosynthesis
MSSSIPPAMPNSPPPSNQPKVSVLMITYNHEKYIAEAIESVLMQKVDFPYELIVGEDCSTDGTREIVREYSRKYPEIIRAHLRERNIGARENSRQVFFASQGNYLALLEGDDYWTSPRKLQIQADLLDAHPETSICGHPCIWHYEDGSQPDAVVPELPRGFYGIENLLRGDRLSTCSVMFRRVVEDIAPECYRHLAMGDLPLFVELARRGNICLFKETMGVYRIHAGGCWSGMAVLRRERECQALYKALYDRLDVKYQPLLRKRLFECSFNLGLESFATDQPGLTRKCLRECLKFSGAFEFIPQKLWLAFKGYCWWAFVVWRRLRQVWRRPARSHT